jgi:hypothetical protein
MNNRDYAAFQVTQELVQQEAHSLFALLVGLVAIGPIRNLVVLDHPLFVGNAVSDFNFFYFEAARNLADVLLFH